MKEKTKESNVSFHRCHFSVHYLSIDFDDTEANSPLLISLSATRNLINTSISQSLCKQ